MTIEKKLLGTSPSGGAANVADVFSTFLFTGNNAQNVINNGIDLAGEGGLVWLKTRSTGNDHALFDTSRGIAKSIFTNTTGAQETAPISPPRDLTNFNSNGFTLNQGYHTGVNTNNVSSVSWTFRNSKKFFKAVTFSYGGSSSSPTVVTHNLGCTVGMTFVKQTNGTQNWHVQHKNVTGNDNNGALNLTIAFAGGNGQSTSFTSITDTQATFGAAASFPAGTYVAYFFADNSSEDAEDQMIKCGIYTGNSNTNGVEINLGWEPQWLLIKASTKSEYWVLMDTMRGIATGGNDKWLAPNVTDSEFTNDYAEITPTGFKLKTTDARLNSSSHSYIYMAIRAPMMKEPEAATEVYKGDYWNNSTPYTINTGFNTDLLVYTRNVEAGSNHWFVDRIRGETARIDFSATTAESTWTHTKLDVSNGYTGTLAANGGNKNLTYAFSRAKGCFDILNYTGNSSSSQNVPHQLGVIPEFVINVRRDNGSKYVVSTAIGTDVMVGFNDQGSLDPRDPNDFFDTPTDTLLKPLGAVNSNGKSYINYLFATLDGVSKCGKYIGNGSSQTINCGFAAGARFIMLKCVSVGSNQGVNTTAWYVWDSARGIVSGNDPYFKLNTASAMVSNTDSIDPTSSGFIVNQNSTTEINNTGRTYIYLAFA